jgi:hypothetical protein
MSDDKLREALKRIVGIRGICFEGRPRCRAIDQFDLIHNLAVKARAATADAPPKDQTVRARQQADGLDNWAKILEAHEPDASARGILMLRAAAKTLRQLAADAPPEVTVITKENLAVALFETGSHLSDQPAKFKDLDKQIQLWHYSSAKVVLDAALATAQPDIPCIQKGCGKPNGHEGRHTDGTLPGHVTAAQKEGK